MALEKKLENRVITFQIDIQNNQEWTLLNDITTWIKAQEKQIKLRFKVKTTIKLGNNHVSLSKFINSNNILELEFSNINESLTLNDALFSSLRCLNIDCDTYIGLNKF